MNENNASKSMMKTYALHINAIPEQLEDRNSKTLLNFELMKIQQI